MCKEAPHPHHTNEELYEKQVQTLRQFLQTGAITQAQFDNSYGDLTAKMHFTQPKENEQ